MPRLIALTLVACVWLCWLAAAAPRVELPQAPVEVPRPPRAPFSPPGPERSEHDGAVVLLLAERELPLVSGWLCFRGGALEEPADRVGLASVLSECLREGGSRVTGGEELDEWLDARAASIEVHAERDSLRIGFNALSGDLADVLGRIADLLASPAYPPDALERARARLESAIARRDDNAAGMADRALMRLAHGPDSPWSREASPASARAITREDLLALHARTFGRARAVIGLCGDFERGAALNAVERVLAALPAGAAPAPPPAPLFDAPARSRLWLLDRPGVPQCELRLTAPGLSRRDPRYPAAYLWSHAVGLGMTSRMMARVRTELGLAYSVGAIFRPEWSVPGRLYAWCGTRNDAAGRALVALIEELQRALTEELPAAELEAARERLLNAEIFRVDTSPKVLQRALDLELAGLPADFHERVLARVQSLSGAEVRAAVASLVHPQQLIAVAVGPQGEIRPALEQVLEVLELPNDRGARGDAPGAALAERMLAALGGPAAWSAVREFAGQESRMQEGVAMRIVFAVGADGLPVSTAAVRADGQRVEQRVELDGSGTRAGSTGRAELSAEACGALRRAAAHTPWLLAARLARGELAGRAGSDGALELWSDRERVARVELDALGRPAALEVELGSGPLRSVFDGWTEQAGADGERLLLPTEAREGAAGERVVWTNWSVR